MIDRSETVARRWVLALASIASFMVALDALVVTTAPSSIRRHPGASAEALGGSERHNLGFAVLLLTARAGDRFGRRRFVARPRLIYRGSAACAWPAGIPD